MSDFWRIRPCPISAAEKQFSDQGWRLHLSLGEDEGNATLAEEQVMPERVESHFANNIRATKGFVSLNLDEAKWLRDALDEVIARMEP